MRKSKNIAAGLWVGMAMILLTGWAVADEAKGDLVITVTGFETSAGLARVAIMNSEKGYKDDILYKGFNLEIVKNNVIKTVEGLPYGEYAIKVFHDENANGELDTRMFGIPVERYGFSNNARGQFGPPDYADVKFILDAPQTLINVDVR